MESRARLSAAAAAAGATTLLSGSASAAPIPIVSHPGDFEVSYQQNGANPDTYNDREGGTGGDELRSGYSTGSGGVKTNAIYYFQLPDVNPTDIVGASFMTSSLPDDADTATAPVGEADLWALGFDNNSPPITFNDANGDVAAQNYYHDNDGPDSDQGTTPPNVFRVDAKIHNDFLVPSEWVAFGGTPNTQTTDATSNATLLAYIQALYAHPDFIPGQSHLILRINPEELDLTTTKRYNVSSAGVTDLDGGPTTDPGAVAPTLTLDVVPEPGTAALAGLAGVALLLRRRQT